MGRISLTALNVRKTAVAKLKAKQITQQPSWLNIAGDIPPAQILIRQQPLQHPLTKVRTRTLPSGKTEQYLQVVEPRKRKTLKDRHLFMPKSLQYEEDSLRSRFFSDHPWELARPRVVLETSGDQYKNADWSTGLIQPGIPLSGESVVQRQLWLLQNVPDITVAQAYDISRKEFYALRRQEETRNRIAAEEARHMGAQFGKSAIQISMKIENAMYNDWERWSRQVVADQGQRAAAFEGTITKAEDETLKEVASTEGQPERPAIGTGVFAQQQKLDSRSLRRTGNSAQQAKGGV
ncbi:hypothetical protein A1O1_08337 [Capronia coronata CBS 617.96]|uniref:37S ribosomal protein S25, mitochondrial n=1 Tax=Capronia coronata CBS 617.96 TaxID=1182541 RepID=W9XS74_9EURO|nr:uncharacterized protein A1O1_08337 [Capronia coronata CBS 617.96]EXJ80195.1 hypothetical protein A1O1_08337 [Capronia coronata CBS 617.96]